MHEVDDFLAHYGVKGMKWGTRRAAGLAERSTANKESTPYRQARLDSKAKRAADNSRGKGSEAVKKATRNTVRDRVAADPEYKKAKEKYDKVRRTKQDVKVAAIGVGVLAAPYILEGLATAITAADRKITDKLQDEENVLDDLHKQIFKSFEKSAYGQARRERGRMFVDNRGYDVVGASREVGRSNQS